MKRPEVIDWLRDMSVVGGVFDGIISVVHPGQYDYFKQQLRKEGVRFPLVREWPFAFGACQLIMNRESLFHRDPSSSGNFLDLLTSIGDYGDQAYFALKTFGVSVPYTSGTVQLSLSRWIEHGVPAVDGRRLALTLFSKDVVCKQWELDGSKKVVARPKLSSVIASVI